MFSTMPKSSSNFHLHKHTQNYLQNRIQILNAVQSLAQATSENTRDQWKSLTKRKSLKRKQLHSKQLQKRRPDSQYETVVSETQTSPLHLSSPHTMTNCYCTKGITKNVEREKKKRDDVEQGKVLNEKTQKRRDRQGINTSTKLWWFEPFPKP